MANGTKRFGIIDRDDLADCVKRRVPVLGNHLAEYESDTAEGALAQWREDDPLAPDWYTAVEIGFDHVAAA